ncbi:hemerythrin domain-containing protein [Catellatospora sp. KI3]|uniref:hemerythrin domain-containing protein n=1 Tax=Catellatospora sp. KI3 TaxID=3041620 RepID=UPI0024828C91|nr:hemerythrin domain-containing protein [Catellatospora sp. KI3]MDI1464677.1 hemerythrin domain-containing protein [Catellatospora sp. KI3]
MPTTSEPHDRISAYGLELIDIHDRLREQLTRLRADIEAHLDGAGPPPRELPAHCLAFCAALQRHHTAEDDHAFTALARRHPDLEPVLDVLRRDHGLVADMLRRLPRLVAELPAAVGVPARADRLLSEVDGLFALLESHFTYEERKLVDALNRLDAAGATPADLLGADPED